MFMSKQRMTREARRRAMSRPLSIFWQASAPAAHPRQVG
jgi:hypothetical protein